MDESRAPEIILPQTSGPCVHCEDGTPYRCAYPYGDGSCPHLDNQSIVCPVKDACYALREVARMRDECEQEERDADMAAGEAVYETETPEWVEPAPEEAPAYTTPAWPKGRSPAHVKEWTAEEDAAIRPATTAAESVTLYRSTVPGSERSDNAIRVRWYKKVRPGLCEARDPLPDFVGDLVPVTQSEEPVFLPGDRVRLVNNPDMVGEVVYVAASGQYVSVQFPGPGPAKVCAIDSIEGVGA